MPLSRRALCTLAVLALAPIQPLPAAAQRPQEVTLEQVRQRLRSAPTGHPRLLLDAAKLAELRQSVRTDPEAAELFGVLRKQAEAMLRLPAVRHELEGRRLLGESRKAVRRILTLSLVHRLDGDPRFLEGARREMLAAAAFPDWNPSHFLDTAEMSFALAVGYDWLFDALGAPDRATIREALLEKGIRASFQHAAWVRMTNNWGQVGHGGITAAALVTLEDEPELAAQVVHRAVTNVPVSMHAYAPDGTYPEGPGYWAYGTMYNVILIAGLESVLGTDFGLSELPGFRESAAYINHATGPTRLFFNYSDGSADRGVSASLQWFAARYQRPEWLLLERDLLRDYLRSERALEVSGSGNRVLPLALVWRAPVPADPSAEPELHWLGTGEVPVAMHRTSWRDPNAIYVGIKAGSPGANHGQMDTGFFVLDADGVRWAMDLGAENYNRIESRGMSLWDRAQGSDRWKVFRNNNRSHSTLVIGDRLQTVEGRATIVKHSRDAAFPHTVVDLTPVYQGSGTRVLRGIGLPNGREVLVQDRVDGVAGEPVRWGMLTEAEVEIRGAREAVLRQDGKQLTLRVLRPAGARLELFDVETPPAEHDSPNPGVRMIGFTSRSTGGAPQDLVVLMTPGSSGQGTAATLRVRPLEEW